MYNPYKQSFGENVKTGLSSLLNFGLLGLMNGQNPIYHGGLLGSMMNQQQQVPPWVMQHPRHQFQRPMVQQPQPAPTTPPIVPAQQPQQGPY